MTKKKLSRSKQCAKCPWKVETDPSEIPRGYSRQKHRDLKKTIAAPASLEFSKTLNVMSCHESEDGDEQACVGWLHNQLGIGNNIGLRLFMRNHDLSDMEIFGEQHEHFEETIK